MKQKELLEKAVNEIVEQRGLFLVEISVSKDNDIDVTVESDSADITLEDCVAISDYVNARLDREVEDYSLTVGSAGLTSPFKVVRQYKKFVGSVIEVTLKEGQRMKVVLESVAEDGISVSYERSVKVEGQKKKVKESVTETLSFSQIKSAKPVISFK
ncbi:MAG: ribosome assembly cofactor RimP [Bacteroidales bacterium]|nr:ribosome assembly cofactor RimP [Bacteroidales bacterium]